MSIENTKIELLAKADDAHHNSRLDQVAAVLFQDFSRARLQLWIDEGMLLLNGKAAKRKDKVCVGDTLELNAVLQAEQAWQAENMPLELLYQDQHLAVVNKPAGLITHPGAGNPNGTLANGLLHKLPELSQIPRAGIVHRLDKDTSGLMVVARSLQAHNSLVQQLQQRTVSRHYKALVHGHPPASGTIDKAMGRHPRQRQKMAVRESGGKPAVTHFKTAALYEGCALVDCQLETGRTHQIRVHMADLAYPLIGDPQYGARRRVSRSVAQSIRSALADFPRQALHAERLSLRHPASAETMTWSVPLPADFQKLLDTVSQPNVAG